MGAAEPERTCVGCRLKAARSSLVRVCMKKGGRPEVDPSGAAPGRGAYVHPSCAGLALARGALARALRTSLAPEEAATLREHLKLLGDR